MSTRIIASVLLAAAVVSCGCDSKTPQPPLATPKPAGAPASPHASAPAGPVAAPAVAGSASTDGPVVSALGVSLTLPAGWKQNAPSSQMRLAEAIVADASGDPAKACVVVFSTAGGSVEENIARWSGQVLDAEGKPAVAKSESRTVGGMKATVVEFTGSFAGMGDAGRKQNWMLRGAIIETPAGLLFIKMNGPVEQMNPLAAGFASLVDSVKKS